MEQSAESSAFNFKNGGERNESTLSVCLHMMTFPVLKSFTRYQISNNLLLYMYSSVSLFQCTVYNLSLIYSTKENIGLQILFCFWELVQWEI